MTNSATLSPPERSGIKSLSRNLLSGGWQPYLELTKPRLSLFSVFTALASYLAAAEGFSLITFILLTIGVSLAAGGAGALNQWWERRVDGQMHRTAMRPLPTAQLTSNSALTFGLVISIVGVFLLWVGIGFLPAAFTFLTLVTYLLWYTPMKRRTAWATEIGALPGALPPLVGWTAATGEIGLPGILLFLILFFWQIPHFMAIAWLYRWDYARGGMPVRTLSGSGGRSAAQFSLVSALVLAFLSILCWPIGFTGPLFALWGTAVSLGFAQLACTFLRGNPPDAHARSLFLGSLLFLPLWFLPLLIDRLLFF